MNPLDAVRAAVIDGLAARRALGGPALDLEVLAADWRPSRRSGDTLLYDARLVVRVRAGEASREAWAVASQADPGSAAGVPELRARVFEALAREVAAEIVAWAVTR